MADTAAQKNDKEEGELSSDSEGEVSDSDSENLENIDNYVDSYLETQRTKTDFDREDEATRFREARLEKHLEDQKKPVILDPKNASKLQVKQQLQAFQDDMSRIDCEAYPDDDIPFPTSQVDMDNSLNDFKTPEFFPAKKFPKKSHGHVRRTKSGVEWATECGNLINYLRDGTFPAYFNRFDRKNFKQRAAARFKLHKGLLMYWHRRSHKEPGKYLFSAVSSSLDWLFSLHLFVLRRIP